MAITFDPTLLSKKQATNKELTIEDQHDGINKLLDEEADDFEANGMRGESRRGWIRVDKSGTIRISVKHSTKRLVWDSSGNNEYPANRENFRETVEMLKQEVLNGRVDTDLRASSGVRKTAAAKRKQKVAAQVAA
jgi:hypothetical protein